MDYYFHSRSIMKQANFNLRSWSSNNPKLQANTKRDQTNDPSTRINLLGLCWNTLDDTLGFIPKQFTFSPLTTKWEILRDSADIWSIGSVLTPITIKVKLLLQVLWRKKVDWLNKRLAIGGLWYSRGDNPCLSKTLLHATLPPNHCQTRSFTDASFSSSIPQAEW